MHVQMCVCANFIQIEAFPPEGLREARETQEVNKLHTSQNIRNFQDLQGPSSGYKSSNFLKEYTLRPKELSASNGESWKDAAITHVGWAFQELRATCESSLFL